MLQLTFKRLSSSILIHSRMIALLSISFFTTITTITTAITTTTAAAFRNFFPDDLLAQ